MRTPSELGWVQGPSVGTQVDLVQRFGMLWVRRGSWRLEAGAADLDQ